MVLVNPFYDTLCDLHTHTNFIDQREYVYVLHRTMYSCFIATQLSLLQ